MKFKGFLVFFLFVSSQVIAGQMASGKITKMMVNTEHTPEMLFVGVSESLTGTPSCNTNGTWQFVLPLTSELQKTTITSFLLAAHMNGQTVRLDGNNTCDTFSSVETLTRFQFVE